MRMVKILDKYEYPSEIDLQEFVDDSLKSKALSSSQVFQDYFTTKIDIIFVTKLIDCFSLSIHCTQC